MSASQLAEVTLADPNADTDTLREMGEQVAAACERQERLLEALLTLSRSEYGGLRREPVDLATTAAKVLRARDHHGLKITSALEPARTAGDLQLVERLLENLVAEAVRYNIRGGRLDVTTYTTAGRANFAIANTGPVIPTGELTRRFQPFQRLSSHEGHSPDGVGRGLAIVQAIADAHDATLIAQARTGGSLRGWILRVVQRLMDWRSVTAMVLVACGLALAACGSSSLVARSSSSDASSGRVLLRGLSSPQAYAVDGELYVTQRVMPNQVWSELMRVNPISGRVYAVRRLGSTFDQALLASGVLWVTTARGRNGWLWRLDPRSLAVLSREVLPGSGPFSPGGTMALAGGWLWVGHEDRLARVAMPGGRVTARIAFPGATVVDVAADPAGRVLLVSEGGEVSHVERRDPHTGRLMSSSGTFMGAEPPYVGGIIGGWAWISQSGGMMGSVQRLAVGTLKPTSFAGAEPHPGITGPPSIFGTNGISARVLDDILWVSQFVGGPERNYCGDPINGRSGAPMPLARYGLFLTADARSIYYVPDANLPKGEELARVAINPRCSTVWDVLRVDGIDHAIFGGRPSTVARLLDELLHRAPSRPYHPLSVCRVDHAIQWPGLTAYFEHNQLVGYQYWSTTTAGEPILATAKGLRVGYTFTRARQLYGRRFKTSAAQGGSWAVHASSGRLYGYMTGPPIEAPHIRIASIAAGYVGCPAVTP